MRIVGLDHVVIYVDDVEAASAFYADVLDAPVFEYGDGWKSVRFDGGQLNFRSASEGLDLVAAEPTVGGADVCLVTQLPAATVVDRLREKGVEIVEGPVERRGSRGTMTSVYFRDPDGNLVEIARYPG